MSFLQEKKSRHFFVFLVFLAVMLTVFSLFFSWLHGWETRRLLFYKEELIASSLLEQGVSPEVVAAALSNGEATSEGMDFLDRIGHTSSVTLWLFPQVQGSLLRFGGISFCAAAGASLLLLFVSLRFLASRERMYRKAAEVIRQFAEGNFERRLPSAMEGTIFQLFGSIEELAMALQAENEKQHRTGEFLQNMISDISHQLKTPLAAMRMYTEIIAEEPDQMETVLDFSHKTLQSLDRMEQLIKTLLKMARLDAGTILFDRRSWSVGELVDRALEELSTRADREKKRIFVKGDVKEVCSCDLEWTGEALGNIIKNALDHTEAGGIISIDWQRSPAMLRMSVEDDGRGIAPEDIYHIFKRFYRSQNSKDRQGAGLGLPLAKAIIEGQGGTVSVSSTYGRGTVFTISFLTEP